MGLWADRVLPKLVEKACRSTTILAERKRWVPRAHGDVLELGVGSGLNLAFYDPATVEHVTGIDPSTPLLARARTRAAEVDIPIELALGRAEELPFDTGRFDSALVTYSLCSVTDPAAALAEVRRVLKPGGELVFVEHGLAAARSTQRWQRWLTPIWRRIGGGCRLDRDIAGLVTAAGFAFDDLEVGHTEGARVLSYTYQGIARPLSAAAA
jgi:ubiquinone/menaquinone biosynthesis C-methylase UbiE